MFLEVKQLTVTYANTHPAAVERVSFSLNAGDIGVLIGPSGCGKTSLLRAVAGLEAISHGDITIAGRCVSEPGRTVAAERRNIGMVFQDYALFPHMTVHDNVAYGLHALRRSEQNHRVAEVLALVGLSDYAQQAPHQLSGGQQQRVALARALAPKPDLLLLDEPFSNLDIELRERLAQDLRNILKQAGATALMVTHDQMEAFAMADTIGVMRKGLLHQWDSADNIYHRPQTRFVAEFIGYGAFIPVEQLQRLSTNAKPDNVPADACDALLRADDIVQDDTSPVKAEIIRKAFRGAAYLYTLRLDSGHDVLMLTDSQHDHALGAHMGVRAKVKQVVAFPAVEASLSPSPPH